MGCLWMKMKDKSKSKRERSLLFSVQTSAPFAVCFTVECGNLIWVLIHLIGACADLLDDDGIASWNPFTARHHVSLLCMRQPSTPNIAVASCIQAITAI